MKLFTEKNIDPPKNCSMKKLGKRKITNCNRSQAKHATTDIENHCASSGIIKKDESNDITNKRTRSHKILDHSSTVKVCTYASNYTLY